MKNARAVLFWSQGLSMAVQLVVRIRGEALGSPTGMAISQRFMAIHVDSVNTRQGAPTKKQPGLTDDEIRATGGEFDSHELGIGGFIR